MMDLPLALQGILVAHNCQTLKKLVNTTALVEMDHKQNALEKEAFHNEERQRPQPNLEKFKLLQAQSCGSFVSPTQVTWTHHNKPQEQLCAKESDKCNKSKKKSELSKLLVLKKKEIDICYARHQIGHKDKVCSQCQNIYLARTT